MVTKRQPAKKQVKVGELKLNKETVNNLIPKDAKKVKGGAAGTIVPWKSVRCPTI